MDNFCALKNFVAVAILIGSTGCATVGKQFNYEKVSDLQLGQTTQLEATELLGEPDAKGNVSNKDGNFDRLRYTYGYGDLSGVAARVLLLEFREGVLNAFVFSSGFEEDSTSFDYTNVNAIRRGKTKKAEAIDILGAPSGRANCPSYLPDFAEDCAESAEILLWMHTGKTRGLDMSSIKTDEVIITIDSNGIVQNISSSSGS